MAIISDRDHIISDRLPVPWNTDQGSGVALEDSGMRITCTNGNSTNKIRGSRITVYLDNGNIVDRFEVPARNGKRYCEKHPGGYYGKRYAQAISKALAE